MGISELTEEQKDEIARLLKHGMMIVTVAEKFGLKPPTLAQWWRHHKKEYYAGNKEYNKRHGAD